MSTIMITGSSRGIGKAAALQFAKEGNTLILVCREKKAALEAVAEQAARLGAVCHTFLCDLSDSQQVQELFQSIQTRHLSIDLLINNAGISYVGLLQDMSDSDWHKVIDSNLSSVFYCCRAVIPMMLQKKAGRIINVSSMWGNYGASCETAYSASKGGINAFTKALAKELAPSGIPVNAAAFGFIDTDMNAALSPEEIADFAENNIPVGRIATAEEAATFLFRLSEISSYMTGQILGFDGGI